MLSANRGPWFPGVSSAVALTSSLPGLPTTLSSGKRSDEQDPRTDEAREQARQRVRDRALDLLKRVAARPDSVSAWDSAFQEEKWSSEALAEVIVRLHQAGRHSEAVIGLKSALRNDHAQPWVYDLLPLQMKLAGASAEEMERVLESRIDFAGADPAQILVSAALMARLEANDAAMRLCRQAADVQPDNPAVWRFSRRIADTTGNPEDIAWSRSGILRRVWSAGYEEDHAEAQRRMIDLAKELRGQRHDEQADGILQQLKEASSRDLIVEVAWSGNADLDLEVSEPDGETCSYRQMKTRNGGRLVRLSNGGRPVSGGMHRETYVLPAGAEGDYVIRIRYLRGRLVAGRCRVQIARNVGRESADTKTELASPTEGPVEFRISIPD